MSGMGQRARRTAELVRAYLSEMLTTEMEDKRLNALVVTDVVLGDDLAVARIGVRLLTGDDDPAARGAALKGLKHASGRLRRALGARLKMRRVPEIAFHYDTGHDAAKRVDALLREIAEEPKAEE